MTMKIVFICLSVIIAIVAIVFAIAYFAADRNETFLAVAVISAIALSVLQIAKGIAESIKRTKSKLKF